jgi:hypothetical protein
MMIERIFDDEQISLLLHDASVGRYTKGAVGSYGVNEDIRKCYISPINVLDYPDINTRLIELGHKFTPQCSHETHFSKELQFLKYMVGGLFKRHRDSYDQSTKPRFLSSITLLDRSEDLEGGELIIYDQDSEGNLLPGVRAELDLYDTVMFNSTTFHECTEITKGTRTVMVSWIHPRDHDISREFFARHVK